MYETTGLDGAVARQQYKLAEQLTTEDQEAEVARAERLERYLGLLSNPLQIADEAVTKELTGLVKEFYLPRSAAEEGRIIDAGGVTYGY